MTPDDLKRLLAEVTPGPWVEFAGRYPGVYASGRIVTNCAKTVEGRTNARLISLAPDLAQEVIDLRAERDRLREALQMVVNIALSEPVDLPLRWLLKARAALGEKNDG